MGSTPRSAYLDNAKAILIILVVFIHLFSPVLGSHEPERSLYLLVLFFHMPAFVFVSGWLSRPELFTKKGLTSLAWLLWAFVAFSMLNHAIWVGVVGWPFQPIKYLKDPYLGLWFLQALIWWRVLLVVFGHGKGRWAAVVSIAVALGVAVLSGYLPLHGPPRYTISRTLAFLPFFVAGYRFKQLGLTVPRTWWSRTLAVLAFVVVGVAIASTGFITAARPLFFNRSFEQLGDSPWASPLPRIALLLIAAVLVAAFLHLVPHRRLPITPLGITVLSVYGWHLLLVRLMKQYDLEGFFAGNWIAVLLSTALIVIVFGYGPIAHATVRVLTGRKTTKGDARG